MRQCELEQVIKEKGQPNFKRTGQKIISFVEGVTPDMIGAIIDLKKVKGLWVINSIGEQDIASHEIKRNWHVGGL